MNSAIEEHLKSGFFFLDKPENCSSFDLIRDLRKKSPYRKFGHTGTLDPFASGLVVLCLNKATKFSSFILNSNKEYLVKMELGIKTDTGDRDGEIISRASVPTITSAQMKEALKNIRQITEQKPPSFSAKKINGKAAYKYARKGQIVDLPLKEITIYDIDVVSFTDNIVIYRAKVSKGTYIRVLSETFAEMLGTIAYTSELRRLSIGNISVTSAVTPDKINSDNWEQYLKPINSILTDYPNVSLPNTYIRKFINGLSIPYLPNQEHKAILDEQKVVVYAAEKSGVYETGDCLGIATIKDYILYPKKVFK